MQKAMMQKISTHEDLLKAALALAADNEDMGRALARVRETLGPLPSCLPDRSRRPGFAALLNLIVGQQVSIASAAAIWQRIEAGVQPLTPQVWLALPRNKIDALGLSKPKKIYAAALAQALMTGTLDLEAVETMDLAAAEAHLCATKGIGPWTARTCLLFCYGAANIWPTGDIALHAATGHLLGLKQRPTTAEMLDLARPWQPVRGIAAHILWAYYKTI